MTIICCRWAPGARRSWASFQPHQSTNGGSAMAKIVLGIGTGHTPLISEPPEFWPEHGATELKAPHAMENAWAGGPVDQLIKERGPKLASEVTAEAQKKRYDQIQT